MEGDVEGGSSLEEQKEGASPVHLYPDQLGEDGVDEAFEGVEI